MQVFYYVRFSHYSPIEMRDLIIYLVDLMGVLVLRGFDIVFERCYLLDFL